MPVSEREKARRRRLAKAHVDAENAHDIEAIMATFAPHAVGQINGGIDTTREAIAGAHVRFGLSSQPGLLTDLQVIPEREHFSEEEIIYEGRFRGRHTGVDPAFPPPSQQIVELVYIVAYRFDGDDRLVSERATVDLSPLVRHIFPLELPGMP
jgi:hypothetical protein